MKLERNLSVIDRVVRLSVGIICVYIGFIDMALLDNKLLSVMIGLFGLINVFAFFTYHCPVYAAAGINTYKQKASPQH